MASTGKDLHMGMLFTHDYTVEGLVMLFLSNRGGAFSKVRLTGMLLDYVNVAGIGKKGACHLFRHTAATLLLEGGMDIRYIQAMLGHAELNTTQIYTLVSVGKLKEIHTARHPVKFATEGQHPLAIVPDWDYPSV